MLWECRWWVSLDPQTRRGMGLIRVGTLVRVRGLWSCETARALRIMEDIERPKRVCCGSLWRMCVARRCSCWKGVSRDELAEDCAEGPCAAGVRICGGVFMAGPAYACIDRVEFLSGGAGALAARIRVRLREEKRRIGHDRSLCVCAESALSGIDPDRLRVCRCEYAMADCRGAWSFIFSHLPADDTERRAVSAWALSGVRGVRAGGAETFAPHYTGQGGARERKLLQSTLRQTP